MERNSSITQVINTIIDRVPCTDDTFLSLLRRALRTQVHLRNNLKDQSSRRSLQSLEGLISRRQSWLIRTQRLDQEVYGNVIERLLRVL